MAVGFDYNKKMGFAIDGVDIPDPSSYGYSTQSLDVSAERDTTGLLHRKMVASKYNVSLSWAGLEYWVAQDILSRVTQPEFQFSFPCPEVPVEQGGLYSGKYYVGDRKVDVIIATDDDMSNWIVSLQFDCIEY